MMDVLPDDLHLQVALFLSAPDVLNLLSVHRTVNNTLGKSESFWNLLLARDSGTRAENEENSCSFPPNSDRRAGGSYAVAKRAFLTHAHATYLPSVKWCPVNSDTRPSAREGHLMCLLGPINERKIVLTGGYSDDDRVHILDINPSDTNHRSRRWEAIEPRNQTPSFVYGASLTRINDSTAIRFGGFRAGGYSAETADVFMLTLEKNQNGDYEVKWERVMTSGQPPASRAYHTATLLKDRYLVIVGGMQSHGSILDEAVLDLRTWTWLDIDGVTEPMAEPKPSPRHGHSVVVDSRRDRLVLFGGGSGSDLLRSGVDNSEVWELKLGDNWNTDFESSLPWQWSRLHRDCREQQDEMGDTEGIRPELSPAERLCLGRCHVGFRVSADMVVLAFGSGRPSTNGLLAYNLKTDTFHRPRVNGPLPMPRFTAAAVVVDDGWLVAHGGYARGEGEIDDVVVLDLAPGMKRTFPFLPLMEEGNNEIISHDPVADDDVLPYNQSMDAGEVLIQLMATRSDQRQNAATAMLHQMMATGMVDGREAFFLSLIANGSATVHSGSDTEGEDDE